MEEKTLKEKAQDEINEEKKNAQIHQIKIRLERIDEDKKYIERLEGEIDEIEKGKLFNGPTIITTTSLS
jgi:hypothetical protein